jgi:hypothetical protein
VGAKKASDAMYRNYLFFSAATLIGAGEAIQYQRTGQHIWENEDWSKVQLGDGRYMVVNKHFAEAIHLVINPGQFVVNKMNLLPRETLAQVLGKEYLTYNPTEGLGGPPMEGGKGAASRAGHVAAQFAPITTKQMAKDPSAWFYGYLGVPVYGSTIEQKVFDARRKAVVEGKDPDVAETRYLKNRNRFAETKVKNDAKAAGKDPEEAVLQYRAKQQSIAEWRASHAPDQ